MHHTLPSSFNLWSSEEEPSARKRRRRGEEQEEKRRRREKEKEKKRRRRRAVSGDASQRQEHVSDFRGQLSLSTLPLLLLL